MSEESPSESVSKLLVRRLFPQPPEQVFAAFTTASAMEQWFAPASDINTQADLYEFREGGRYAFSFELPDASTARLTGTFEEIRSPSRLAYSWCWEEPDPHAGIESHVGIDFLPHEGGTELVVQHRRLHGPGMVPRHTGGWHDTLDQLEGWLRSASTPKG